MPKVLLVGRCPGAWLKYRRGWRTTQLLVRLRRFTGTHCRRVRQDTSALAESRARLTNAAVEMGIRALDLEAISVSRVAEALGNS